MRPVPPSNEHVIAKDVRSSGSNPEAWVAVLAAARGGCQRSMGEILDSCRRYLLVIANSELPFDVQAKAGASDLVQETLLEAGLHFQVFRGECERDLLAWLQGILQHRLGTLTRQFHTAKRHVNKELPLNGSDSNGPGNLQCDKGPSPSGWAVAREEIDILNAALARLPAEQAESIRLRNQQGLSFAELGRRMQRSPEAARKLWARAVERLTAELEQSNGKQ